MKGRGPAGGDLVDVQCSLLGWVMEYWEGFLGSWGRPQEEGSGEGGLLGCREVTGSFGGVLWESKRGGAWDKVSVGVMCEGVNV